MKDYDVVNYAKSTGNTEKHKLNTDNSTFREMWVYYGSYDAAAKNKWSDTGR